MGLSDDQRDEAMRALKGAEETLHYVMKGVNWIGRSGHHSEPD